MDETLQKAIHHLDFLERAKGRDHSETVAQRAQVKILQKAKKEEDDEDDGGADAKNARSCQEHHEGVAMSYKKAATAYEKGDKGTGDVHKADADNKAKVGPNKK